MATLISNYGYNYGYSSGGSGGTLTIIAVVLAIIAAIALMIFVAPESKREQYKNNKAFVFINDLLNFKALLIDKILKFLYILCTCLVIFVGFFNLFVKGGFLSGLLTMLIGPFVVRIVYEMLMLLILLVRNVIQINKKMPNNGNVTAEDDDLFN